MLSLRPHLGALLLGLLTSLPLRAQPASEPAKDPPPAATAPSAPPLPEVHDEMLDPPPPAANVLATFRQGVELVKSQLPSLRISLARIEQEEGSVTQSLARVLPTFAASGAIQQDLLLGEGTRFITSGVQRGTIPYPELTWNGSAAINVPLFAPRSWFDLGTAARAVESARYDARNTDRVALAALTDSVILALTAERLADVSRASLKSALVTLQLTRRTVLGGTANVLDVLRATQEVLASRTQVLKAHEAVLRARESLGAALGTSSGWSVAPELRIDDFGAELQSFCRPESAAAARDDVKASKADVVVEERRTRSVDYGLFPTLGVTTSATYWSNPVATPNGEHVTWTISGLLSWSIFDGGLRKGERRMNLGLQHASEARAAETQRRAELEVAQATRTVKLAQDSLEVSKQARDVAVETARLARIGFAKGIGTSFELVEATRRLRESEMELAVRDFDLLRAKLDALLSLASCKL